jgi:NADH dehydrogenase
MFRRELNVRVLLAEVTDLDLDSRTVEANVPDGDRLTLRYDTLVVAAGATHAYFGHDEWADPAPGMKTIEDARRLRSHVLGAFEMAEASADPAQRDEWLTFVIVGAGPTGVELTGQVAALASRTLRGDYRNVDTTSAKIILLDAGPHVLPPFPEKLRRRAERDLREVGVDIRLHTKATAIDERGIEVEGPQGEARIPSRTVIWAAGVQASPLAKVLGEASGAEVDRAGRVGVEPDCTLPGHPEVFAIGDMVSLNGLPGVAQPALQEGKYVAQVIESRLAARSSPGPFKYFDKGTMATIGRKRAVANAFGLELSGRLAVLTWAFIHIAYLVGWGNRFGTTLRWMWTLAARNRRERLISVPGPPQDETRPPPERGREPPA